MKIKDENYTTSTYSDLTTKKGFKKEPLFIKGCVFTSQGIVSIYQQGYGENHQKYLTMTFIMLGRAYHRTIKGKIYTEIGISRKANQFVKQLFKKI